jgi:hypothetical protein
MAKKKTAAPAKPRKPRSPRPAAPKAPPAVARSGFELGQRVTVTAPGSFAARQCGKVTGFPRAGFVNVLLDHKQADKEIPAGDLAAA